MKTTLVLSHNKMLLISVALLPLKHSETSMKRDCVEVSNRVDDQLVKPFGTFNAGIKDARAISIAVYGLWVNNKSHLLADNTRSGYLIRKNMQAILNTFTGIFMDMVNNARGLEFRKQFYLSRVDMNC